MVPCAMTSLTAGAIGAALLGCRRDRGWSQARLSAESGVPQTVVSTIERAVHLNPPLETVRVLCRALDAELIVDIRPARLVGKSDQKDPAHAACVAATRRILERAGWLTASEVEIVTGRAHGFIDLLAFDPLTGRILVIEVKTEIRDVGGLERQVGWYMRAAPARRAGSDRRDEACRGSWSAWRQRQSTLRSSRTAMSWRPPSRSVGARCARSSSRVPRSTARDWCSSIHSGAGPRLVDARRGRAADSGTVPRLRGLPARSPGADEAAGGANERGRGDEAEGAAARCPGIGFEQATC